MNRIVVAALALFTGCAHRAVPAPAVTAVMAPPTLRPAPTPDAIAAVKEALSNATVRFAFDRDLLDEDGMRALQKLARVLRKYPAVTIMVAGNSDERGTEEYNLLLGQRRAEAARHYLWALGVPDDQVVTVSYGSELPLALDQTEESYAVNRRDDLSVQQDQTFAAVQ